MRTTAIGLALFAVAALPAFSPGAAADSSKLSACGRHVRLAGHHDVADARLAITTEDGKVTLVLTDRVVAFQLSDRTLHKVDRELRSKKEEQDNWFGAVIVTAVVGTVREFIDNSMECRVRDLRDVSYEDGRLVFTARDGRLVFDDMENSHRNVTEAFSERDARKFVREFRSLRGQAY
jgi:hypothetical protein